MELNEAYDEVIRAIAGLVGNGVPAHLEPSTSESAAEGQALPREKWMSVSFPIKCGDERADLVYEESIRLARLGIEYDTDGSPTELNWKIDWSFRMGTPKS